MLQSMVNTWQFITLVILRVNLVRSINKLKSINDDHIDRKKIAYIRENHEQN